MSDRDEARTRALRTRAPADGLAFFASLPPSSIKMGLGRVRAALATIGSPEASFPALHVAGTNGKGSTCALAATCLAQRYHVGLYTSPHLERPNERIKIDGVDIDDDTFGRRIIEVLEHLPAAAELTYFELGTVVAFWHFAQEKVQLAVLETGLGGRLDATTACQPLVTAITPVSFDHMEYLGHTLPDIAAEKAGIVKEGVPLVSAAQPPDVLPVLREAARAAGSKHLLEGRDFEVTQAGEGLEYDGVRWQIDGLSSTLRGPHQRQNLAVALACLEQLSQLGFELSADELRAGVAATRWPGRLEEFHQEGQPAVVLDGAHNPGGVTALLAALDEAYSGRPLHLVFGVFADKDYRPMIEALFPRCEAVYLTPIANPRALDPARYLEEARSLCARVSTHPDPASALAAARSAAPPHGLVLCAGSLFLLGQLRPILAR